MQMLVSNATQTIIAYSHYTVC